MLNADALTATGLCLQQKEKNSPWIFRKVFCILLMYFKPVWCRKLQKIRTVQRLTTVENAYFLLQKSQVLALVPLVHGIENFIKLFKLKWKAFRYCNKHEDSGVFCDFRAVCAIEDRGLSANPVQKFFLRRCDVFCNRLRRITLSWFCGFSSGIWCKTLPGIFLCRHFQSAILLNPSRAGRPHLVGVQ